VQTSAVADLVQRTSIRGLSLVLDPDAFLEALRRVAPRVDFRAGQISYVNMRLPAHASVPPYCRVGYRIDVGGEGLDLDVRAGKPEDIARWRAARGAAEIPGPLGFGRIVLEDSAILVHVFPNDPKLKAVRHLIDARELVRMLPELCPTRPDLWQAELRPMRYRPERRFVAELRGAAGGRALLKCCTRGAYARSKHNATAFEPDGPLRIAKLLGFSDEQRLLVFEWLEGESLFDRISAPELDRGALAVSGAALAVLHSQRPEGLASWTRESAAAHLAAIAAEIGFVCPGLAGRAEELSRRLQEELPQVPPAGGGTIHGDISARHLLVGDQDVGIVDLDWACYGDPADDLGYLVAQVERTAVRGKVPPDRVERVREALLAGYGLKDEGPFRRRIDLYTAVGIFQQTRFPFRSWASDWPVTTEALLARAETYASALK
jgi:phosphotransferase family enzyme